MSEFINRPCIREQCEPRERGLDYSSIMSNRVKQVSSPPRYQRYIEPPSPNNRTLSRFDCYLGFLFMTKALIYDRIRGIMIAKKFMESLNYVNVIIHFPKTRCGVSNRFFWQKESFVPIRINFLPRWKLFCRTRSDSLHPSFNFHPRDIIDESID